MSPTIRLKNSLIFAIGNDKLGSMIIPATQFGFAAIILRLIIIGVSGSKDPLCIWKYPLAIGLTTAIAKY